MMGNLQRAIWDATGPYVRRAAVVRAPACRSAFGCSPAKAFSYVGVCQLLRSIYMMILRRLGLCDVMGGRVVTSKRLGGRIQLFELVVTCTRPMKTSTRATTPIHAYGLWSLTPCPKMQVELSSLTNHSEVPRFNLQLLTLPMLRLSPFRLRRRVDPHPFPGLTRWWRRKGRAPFVEPEPRSQAAHRR